MFPRPRDLLLLLAAICCGMGLLPHATHADEFEKARAAELAERREGEQRRHLSGTRARFFRYTEIDSKGDDHYPASAFADDILSGKVRQATDRDPIAEWFYRTLLGLKPLRDEVPFAALTQGPDSLPRSYRKSAPYYILARTYELQLGRTNMNGKSGGKSVFHVSTDHPGYWYFVKGLKKASFHGGTKEDGVDYLLKALSIAATGKKALASSWLKDTSAFYATDYRFSPERKKKLPVWSGDLGFRKVEKFWGPDYYVRRGRKYGYNEVVAAINEANAARVADNCKCPICVNRKCPTLKIARTCTSGQSVGKTNRNGAANRCTDGRQGCC
ncbi:MAG: hypothetical protein OXF11_21975 [Deltaproteobacteria bacterium]|nr:hypothetical protein [Deltaproteobacteria bacterium]